jgi:hypothetical protein
MTGMAEIEFSPVVFCTELFLHISFILIRCVAMFSAAMTAYNFIPLSQYESGEGDFSGGYALSYSRVMMNSR